MKSVRIWRYPCPYFPAFGLNTERHSLPLCIQSEGGNIWTRITPNTDTFNAVIQLRKLKTKYLEFFLICKLHSSLTLAFLLIGICMSMPYINTARSLISLKTFKNKYCGKEWSESKNNCYVVYDTVRIFVSLSLLELLGQYTVHTIFWRLVIQVQTKNIINVQQ